MHHWISTICFRQFRDKLTALSGLYWTYMLGVEATQKLIAAAADTDFIVDVVGATFKRAMLPEKVGDVKAHVFDQRAGIERVHLLAICSANLESYLQDAIRLYVADLGHQRSPRRLTPVGDALARPVVNSSTVPDMVEYTQELLSVNLSKSLAAWRRAYKIRCAAVHNGGFVTPKVRREIPDIGFAVGERITLDWHALRGYMAEADEIASVVDRKISTTRLRALESEWLIDDLRQNNSLPSHTKVWQLLHDQWGVQGIPRAYKRKIVSRIYGIHI